MADMSPEAVTARLRRASQLAALCVELSRATPVVTARELERDPLPADRSGREPAKLR